MNQDHTITIEEGDRQAILLAIAHLSIERPGWEKMLIAIALKMDNRQPDGRPQMFDEFRSIEQQGRAVRNTETKQAAGFCRGLRFRSGLALSESDKEILNHAANVLAEVAGITFLGSHETGKRE
jgi:hypothetical protein